MRNGYAENEPDAGGILGRGVYSWWMGSIFRGRADLLWNYRLKSAARSVALVAILGFPQQSIAATGDVLVMICQNPRQEYRVSFDTLSREFLANDTSYKVLAVEISADRFVVSGMVGNDSNLGFAAHFHPYTRVDFYQDDQLFQMDACRKR